MQTNSPPAVNLDLYFPKNLDLFKQNIEHIKDRYYRKTIDHSEGTVTHHGNCHIYRAFRPHCSCGLLHDLMSLIHFQEEIFPQFGEHIAISEECQIPDPLGKQEEKEIKTITDDFLKTHRKATIDLSEEHKIIKEVFPYIK